MVTLEETGSVTFYSVVILEKKRKIYYGQASSTLAYTFSNHSSINKPEQKQLNIYTLITSKYKHCKSLQY